jgi:hypothetical protein
LVQLCQEVNGIPLGSDAQIKMSATESFLHKASLREVSNVSLESDYSLVKRLIWLYFLLLLFEGALRKWFLPSLSNGLLIIRDPIVLSIYFIAYNQGIFPLINKYLNIMFKWSIVAAIISFIVQAHPLTVAYGIRTNLLHFPLIFVMGRILSWQDVINFGKAFLILALPMTWVVSQQFQADRLDLINVASGGTGHQMMTSGDKVRASGTFSFVSGIVFYYCFTVAYIIYGFVTKTSIPKWMLYLGTAATFLAMVTAGSRAVIAESLQVFGCLAFLAYHRPNEFGSITASTFLFTAIGFILYYLSSIYRDGMEFLSLRFDEAANVEGHPIEAYFVRYWEIIHSPIRSLDFQSFQGWLGSGIGSGTRAGAALGRGVGYELDWDRHIYENGAILGVIFILIRFWITKDLLFISISAIKRNSYLAILLWGASAPILFFGILGQPTNLGFAAFGGGLCLAAAKRRTS